MIDLDIFTKTGAKNFLMHILDTDEHGVRERLVRGGLDDRKAYTVVRKEIGDQFSSDDFKLHLRHVTSNSDECKSISKYGICGIRDVLSGNNELALLFRRCGVLYDPEADEVVYRGNRYFLPDYSGRRHFLHDNSGIEYLVRILATDSCVNSFIYEPCIRGYSVLARYPEIVEGLERAIGTKSLINEWKSRLHPYVIEFTASINQLDSSNLMPEEDDLTLWSPCEGRLGAVLNVLILKSIQVLLGCCKETFAFFPQGYIINPSSITRITPLELFCIHMCEDAGEGSACDEVGLPNRNFHSQAWT